MTEPYYQDEWVTLYHGDCREVDLPSSDLVLTDPPYGVSYSSNSGVGRGTKPITNDGARLALRLQRSVLPRLQATHVLWFTRWDAWPDVWVDLGQWFRLRGLLVWDKGSPGMGDLNHWGPSYEMIASCGPVRTRGGRDCSVLRYNTVPSANRNHPTEKPIALFEYLIEKASDVDATILDPFMGSGTTGVAAAKTGRKFVGCEVDPIYFDTACRRIEEAYRQPRLFAEPVVKHEQPSLLSGAL